MQQVTKEETERRMGLIAWGCTKGHIYDILLSKKDETKSCLQNQLFSTVGSNTAADVGGISSGVWAKVPGGGS